MKKRKNYMKPGGRFLIMIIVCIAILTNGCGSPKYVVTDRGQQAYYQTGYPVRDTSKDLERLFRSVKRINVTGHYNIYVFSPEAGITQAELNNRNVFKEAEETYTYMDTKAGTAIVVSSAQNHTALLTNDHVVEFPDTLIRYFENPDGKKSPYIEQVSIRTHQINLIYDLPELGSFEILARDKTADLALIGVRHPRDEEMRRAPILRISPGQPQRLAWGSFTYILGYPKGYKMVTRGIVSDPNRDRRASFLLDATFNEGISGGLVVAIRGDTGELEWIGMARGGSASTELLLTPEELDPQDIDFLKPYDGDLYINLKQRIEYGITLSVSMKTIQRFFKDHERELARRGYSFSRYLDN